MMTATGTRTEARKHLSGKWNKGALIAFCYFIVEYVLELIGKGLANNVSLFLAFQIIVFIISVPISYGFIISFVKLKRDEEVNAFSFLQIGFSNFSKAWSVAWNKFLKMIVPTLLVLFFIILTTIFISINTMSRALNASISSENAYNVEKAELSYYNAKRDYSANPTSANYKTLQQAEKDLESAKARNTDINTTVTKKSNTGLSFFFIIIATIVYIASTVYLTIKSLSLSLATFITYDDESISGKEACNLSQQLMKGNKGNLFVLSLSFIGWAILAIFTLGIGYFWLIAYMHVSTVCFYEAVSNRNIENNLNNNIEEIQ